jgi:hypothetical protein
MEFINIVTINWEVPLIMEAGGCCTYF